MGTSPRQPIHRAASWISESKPSLEVGRIEHLDVNPIAINADSEPVADSEMPFTSTILDRGESRVSNGRAATRFVLIARSASLELVDSEISFWIVLRGSAQVKSKEGQFWLQPGSWLALDGESKKTLLADGHALVLALSLPAGSGPSKQKPELPMLYPGRGVLSYRDRVNALALWREAAAAKPAERRDSDLCTRMLHFLSTLQLPLYPYLNRCPGSARARRRHVFTRMQRVLLWLEGNVHRTVPLSELSALCNFSSWYFTKTFTAIYGQGPRQMTSSFRLRLAGLLLERPDLSIGDIGFRCGFQNACSFARAFRGHYGMSASEYRQAKRNEANSGTDFSRFGNEPSGRNAKAMRKTDV